MNILIVSYSKTELQSLAKAVKNILPDAEVSCFNSSLSSLAEARQTEYDVAIIDVLMPELGGLDLGQYLKELHPFINIIFLSKSRKYAYDAILLRCSGYLLKPLSEDALARDLGDLRYPDSRKNYRRVFAQTFGNFDLFVDGRPVAFKYVKTKEIVALLINNRGSQTTNGEIISVLWEDDGDPEKKSSYLGNLRQDLQNTFHRLKLDGVIQKQRGSMAICPDKIECDLYDWLANKENSKYRYFGEYMNQYSWGEYLHAELDEMSYQINYPI